MSADSAPAEYRQPARLAWIDGVRALAALFVVVCHAWHEPTNGYYGGWLMNHLGMRYGHIAPDVFIVVSGFCLMLPIARRGGRMGSLRTFISRRCRRILPPYYAALGLSVLFVLTVAGQPTGTVWDNSLPLTWRRLIGNLLLVHNFPIAVGAGSINYPLWSIAVEFQLYLLMPLIVLSLRRTGAGATLGWTIASGVLLGLTLPQVWVDSQVWYLGLFALGIVAAREAVRRETIPAGWRWLAFAIWVGAGIAILATGRLFFERFAPLFDTAIGLATALFLATTYRAGEEGRRPVLTRVLSWRPLVAVGLFSYSVYLLHAPVLHALHLALATVARLRPEVEFLVLLGLLPVVVGVSYLFHLACERPFMQGSGGRSGGAGADGYRRTLSAASASTEAPAYAAVPVP